MPGGRKKKLTSSSSSSPRHRGKINLLDLESEDEIVRPTTVTTTTTTSPTNGNTRNMSNNMDINNGNLYRSSSNGTQHRYHHEQQQQQQSHSPSLLPQNPTDEDNEHYYGDEEEDLPLVYETSRSHALRSWINYLCSNTNLHTPLVQGFFIATLASTAAMIFVMRVLSKGGTIDDNASVITVPSSSSETIPTDMELPFDDKENVLDLPPPPPPAPAVIHGSDRYETIKSILIQQDVSEESRFNDVTSSQHRALTWLADVDDLQLTVSEIYFNDNNAEEDYYEDMKHLIQRYTLVLLYYSTGGGENVWTSNFSFLDGTLHECEWGVVRQKSIHQAVENEEGTKGESDMSSSSSGGGMVVNKPILECDDTMSITMLHLGFNNLHGTIPSEISQFKNSLEELWLGGNELSGTIPSEIGYLINLNWLNIRNNKLTGIIPSEIGYLHDLQGLYLEENKLRGTIPQEIGGSTMMTKLTYIELYDNLLTGTIPSTFSNLKSLRLLYLHRNEITGNVDFLCNELQPNLATLWIDQNEVECDITTCCTCCAWS